MDVARRAVWIVDSEHWPRALLRAELIERGYDAVGFEAVRDVLVRLALVRFRPELLLLVLHGQAIPERQIAALRRTRLPIWLLASAAVVPDERLTALASRLLRRPLTVGSVADAVASTIG